VVIPNPVLSIDIPAINLPKEGKKIILVARLAVEKGILRLLQIFKNLPEEYTLTIAGDGPLKKEILKEIIHQQLHKRVQLVGVVNNITKLMASHHLLVLPSVTEGFPNVVLESLSVGTPVVAFRVSGVQAIINSNFNGYIIDQGDLNSFEKHIIKACNQNWDHQAIKEDVNTRFSVQKVVKQYETLLSYR
jgi:glycosyltransferase involved in cell wall biosynthesis